MTKKKSKTNGKPNLLRKILRGVLYILLVFVSFSLLLAILYRWINPPVTPLMVLRKIESGLPINQKWKDLEDISPCLINCAVAAEDNNFLGHHGFDFGAIQKAIDGRDRGRYRGASTISQQTAKNIFLWDGRSWIRKGLEVYFTFLIETFWSKERIMEVYLNKIEMGNGIYGAEVAAQHYFRKSAKQLNGYQAALIVAAFPAPLTRNPSQPTSYLSARANHIFELSQKIGQIKFDENSIKKARERYQKRETRRRKKIDGKLLELQKK
ncbi:MAG: monofunctional biosynthetic peptidoglycan transglycosylase [Bacteroidales bacterium]|jgi:monofunctional biosynthetic peptidoglycan transglycosylase|nr:monofunctional biosynthetic peptidoglycan transglycosylase [Bacteroidales bacterium]